MSPPPFQDRLNNVRRQQRQSHHPTHVGPVLQHPTQPERLGDRLDHGVVDVPADGRRGDVRAVGRDDELAAAALADLTKCAQAA